MSDRRSNRKASGRIYANGQPDDIRVRRELREGDETRALDLKGRDRVIDRIELTTKREFKGRGAVPRRSASTLSKMSVGIGGDKGSSPRKERNPGA